MIPTNGIFTRRKYPVGPMTKERRIGAAQISRAVAVAYEIPKEDLGRLFISHNTRRPEIAQARYAIWTVLYDDAEWHREEIATEFGVSGAGVSSGIRRGQLMVGRERRRFVDACAAGRKALKKWAGGLAK